jgi:hypothetical protein
MTISKKKDWKEIETMAIEIIKRQMLKWHNRGIVRHWRKNKHGIYELIWMMDVQDENILHDTGEIAILSAFFATAMTNYGAPPANLYLGLDSRASLAEADTLATLAELTKSGYERKAVISGGTGANGQDFYINQPAAYYRADSKTVEWTAGEDWVTGQKNIFLCTDATATTDAASKHLVCSLALSATRTLLNGDKLDGSMYIGLSE